MPWNPITQAVDYATLAGRRTPGIAEITGAAAVRNYRERRPFGMGGATVVFHGVELAKFVLKLRLYTEQHWDEWHAFKSLVATPRGESVGDFRTRAVRAGNALVPRAGESSEAFQRRLESTGTLSQRRPTSPPLDIGHPVLEDLGVRSVVIESVSQPEQTGDGEWTIAIKMIEHRALERQLEIPGGSQARPTDPVDLLIENLSGQAQVLANG
jgi:hypothetical protein